MRKIILVLVTILTTSIYAQQGFNYKAVLTDNGEALQNHGVSVKFTIKNMANIIKYQETHGTTTDENGMIILNIGEGTSLLVGDFYAIDWSNEHQLSVQVDTGSGYDDFGTTTFKAVPNAKMAAKAEALLPTDKIVIGEYNDNHNERLYVFADDNSVTSELADFRLETPSASSDVLNISFGEAPSSGVSQFIECNVNGVNAFWVDHTGDVHTQGNLKIKHDINFWFNGEVNAAYSGDADMKAFIYGMVGSTGDEVVTACSSGFESSKLDTGIYRIAFTTAFSNVSDYIVMATAIDVNSPQIVTVKQFTSHVDIYIWDLAGDEVNSQFNFVVFKK
jgi:hypothetical protein